MATMTLRAGVLRSAASPRLPLRGACEPVQSCRTAFGATEIMRFEHDGHIGHAEIMIQGSIIMLAEEWPEGDRYSAETLGNSPVLIHLDVPDVDAFIEHAVSAGAKQRGLITDQFYGHRDGTLVDPFGYVWSISTRKEALTLDEMHRRFRAMMA